MEQGRDDVTSAPNPGRPGALTGRPYSDQGKIQIPLTRQGEPHRVFFFFKYLVVYSHYYFFFFTVIIFHFIFWLYLEVCGTSPTRD